MDEREINDVYFSKTFRDFDFASYKVSDKGENSADFLDEFIDYWMSSGCPMAYGFFKGLLASKYWDFSK